MTGERGLGRSVYPTKDHVLLREPRCPARMPYLPRRPAARRAVVLMPTARGSLRVLLECLEEVPEPRRRCGIRHRVAVVLAFTAAAVLGGRFGDGGQRVGL